MAGSLRMYAISKTPNSEVLDDTTTGGPPLPTIHELDPLVPSKAEWLWRGRRGLLFFPNGEFIAKVKLHHHLQPLLSDPASTASDVYLVARPESLTIPFGSLLHWSFYTQGFFYHLSALDRSRDDTWSSQNPTKSTNTVCRLKYEDLSTVNSEDYIRFQGPLGRKVFLAYKVGQTDYRPDQILKLAEWVVRQLSAYGLFSANCQHFATTMVRRTVMRVGDRSAFAGTATQIVDWDLRKESQLHVNGIERGFLVAPPLPSMKYSPIALKIDILSANRSLYIVDESMLDSFLSKCSWLFKGQDYLIIPTPVTLLTRISTWIHTTHTNQDIL